jgi:hypothetical protein
MSTIELLTVDELCLRWKCSRAYVYAAINRGALVAMNIGGWKVRADEAERFEAASTKRLAVRRKPGPKKKPRFATKGV